MAGISAYGTYVPYARLDRKTIAEALGTPPGKGTRAVASHDEDTTSMGEVSPTAFSASHRCTTVSWAIRLTQNPAV